MKYQWVTSRLALENINRSKYNIEALDTKFIPIFKGNFNYVKLRGNYLHVDCGKIERPLREIEMDREILLRIIEKKFKYHIDKIYNPQRHYIEGYSSPYKSIFIEMN